MIQTGLGWASRKGSSLSDPRGGPTILIDPRLMQVVKSPETQADAETPDKTGQLEPVTPNKQSSRRPILLLSLFALLLNGAAAVYTLPSFDIASPNFASLAELLPHASAPIPDPIITGALKDIQSAHQQYLVAIQESGATLQQNTILLQRGAASLDSLKQGLVAQQTDVKKLSAQLYVLAAKVDTLQNAVMPETTGSLPQMRGRARLAALARKKTSRLPKPVGPVSVGGAPLSFSSPPTRAAVQSPQG
jgi:cell division protein FtsB